LRAPHFMNLVPTICDMIDSTIGVLRNPPPVESTQSGPTVDTSIQAGYAFVAMPIDNDDHQLGYKGLSDYRVSQHERTKGWDHEETHCADRKAERLDAENLLYFPMGI